MLSEIKKNVRFNFAVNVSDGAFFGMGLGFASFVTIIPLFVNTFTDSSLLIGLIASSHLIGWQLPQILTATRVSKLPRFKTLVIRMTVHERWPFLGLALVAIFSKQLGPNLTIVLTFVMCSIQAFGGGFAATAWQAMVAKIFPDSQRGTFYGTQSAAANLLASGSALFAGMILAASDNSMEGFALNFLIAGVVMFFSFSFLAMTREPATQPVQTDVPPEGAAMRRHLVAILRRDGNYRLFIVGRMLLQAASIGSAFYTVFAVRRFEMDAGTAGVLTGVLLLAATIGNPLFGWLGDRWNRRLVFGISGLLAGASALVALLAPSTSWFFLVFILFGLSNGGMWTTANAMTVDFGSEHERPYYIGLANTLVAPVTLFAPMLGGWLADVVSFEATFLVAAVSGVVAAAVAFLLMQDPLRRGEAALREQAEPASA
ncbi:MAG: MFS transporter [Chloroflexi bacterium]|nr:MFS transporter [Chloroflexota bacterium]